MILSTYKTEAAYSESIRNTVDTFPQYEPKSNCGIFILGSTLAFASLFTHTILDEDQYKRSFPTAFAISPAPINLKLLTSIEEPFQFENSEEVTKFIEANPSVTNLYKSLPSLIKSVFGDVKVRLSVFKDNEENWSNLRVEIDSNYEIDALGTLEDAMISLIEKDDTTKNALELVTISCV